MRTSLPRIATLAATLTLITTLNPATPAHARVVSGNDGGLVAESVDKHTALSLTVRKAAANPFDEVPAGARPPAIAGARFTLARVEGIDVTTTAGRERAKGFTLDDASLPPLQTVAQRATDADGEAVFTGLEPGLYLLTEAAPDTQHDYHVASPMLIVLPLGDVTGTHFQHENVVVTKPDRGGGTSTTPTTPQVTTPGTTTPQVTTPPTTSRLAPPETERTTASGIPGGGTNGGNGGTNGGSGGDTGGGNGGTDGGRSRIGGGLAYTGANVLWAVALAALLIATGVYLTRRSKN